MTVSSPRTSTASPLARRSHFRCQKTASIMVWMVCSRTWMSLSLTFQNQSQMFRGDSRQCLLLHVQVHFNDQSWTLQQEGESSHIWPWPASSMCQSQGSLLPSTKISGVRTKSWRPIWCCQGPWRAKDWPRQRHFSLPWSMMYLAGLDSFLMRIFSRDAKLNRRNNWWIASNPEDVPIVSRTQYLVSVHVVEVISSKGDMMPPHFLAEGEAVTKEVYLKVLKIKVKPWMVPVAAGRLYLPARWGPSP